MKLFAQVRRLHFSVQNDWSRLAKTKNRGRHANDLRLKDSLHLFGIRKQNILFCYPPEQPRIYFLWIQSLDPWKRRLELCSAMSKKRVRSSSSSVSGGLP